VQALAGTAPAPDAGRGHRTQRETAVGCLARLFCYSPVRCRMRLPAKG